MTYDKSNIYEQLEVPQGLYSIPKHNGITIYDFILKNGIKSTIETGFCWGVSTAYIMAATQSSHIAIDPFQKTYWKSTGINNLEKVGLKNNLILEEDYSHFVLPRLAKEAMKFDFAFIDGNHLFDYCFIDLYYMDLMIEQGGYICFDDIHYFPSVAKVADWLVKNKAYQQCAADDRLVFYQKIGEESREGKHFVDF